MASTISAFPLPRPVITPSFLERLQIETGGSFHCHAITADLQALVERSGVQQGLLVAVGQHTTTALVLNENEELLLRDIEAFFLALAPPERPWLHNDLHLRQGIPPDEPRNAHAHLIAMLLGNQLSLPVVDGRLGIGRWQSVLLVELDGPRQREVLLQLIDTGGPSPPTASDSMLRAAP
jgi:secondary thiamine-phosphate synthase enzyme